MSNQHLIKITREFLKHFKIYGEPANEKISDGQCEIAGSILFKINPRVACLASTGYGKSEAVAIGTMARAIWKREQFIIASVKFGTSGIIMKKVIDHIFDDEFLTYQLELEQGQRLDRLKRERKKDTLSFREGGGIRIVSLHGKDEDVAKAIGEHVGNIILDESPLLTPSKYFQVLKILEGTGSYKDSFLLELGNAVNRNHFRQNVLFNDKYYVINISLEQAYKEGRLDPESVEEKRGMPFFEQFYLNKFPKANEVDNKGYRALVTDDQLDEAFVDEIPYTESTLPYTDMKLGADVGGGGDANAYIARSREYAWIDGTNNSNDTMTNVVEIENRIEKGIAPDDVFIDDVGIGRGASDRLVEKGHAINAVSAGSKSSEPDKYANVKAEAYWKLREWILAGGKLKRDDRFKQITWIKYKVTSDKVLIIEPKVDLKRRKGSSPDFAEGLMLTFAPKEPTPGLTFI